MGSEGDVPRKWVVAPFIYPMRGAGSAALACPLPGDSVALTCIYLIKETLFLGAIERCGSSHRVRVVVLHYVLDLGRVVLL